MIADAQITFVPVSDLERSRTLYEDVLGLQLDQGTAISSRPPALHSSVRVSTKKPAPRTV